MHGKIVVYSVHNMMVKFNQIVYYNLGFEKERSHSLCDPHKCHFCSKIYKVAFVTHR